MLFGRTTWPIEFMGRLSKERVRVEMRRAATLCVPSYTETFGIVYDEAQFSGDLLDRRTLFSLPKGKGNLLLCEPCPLHSSSPFQNETLPDFSHFGRTSFRGAGQYQFLSIEFYHGLSEQR